MLLFLDPCGALLPFETIIRSFNHPRRSTGRSKRIPTVALLDFSAGLVRRVGGAWIARSDDAYGVAKLTPVCRGDCGPAGGAPD